MNARTKMIATVGPSTASEALIEELIQAGITVFRINFSHGSQAEHLQVIQRIHRVRTKLKKPVAIMMDTKGFEIRVENELSVEKGRTYKLGGKGDFLIRPSHVIESIETGMELLFDDGYLVGKCTGTYEGGVLVEFKNSRFLKANKNVHIPSARLKTLDLNESDASDIAFACKHGVEWIAASFVSSKANISAIKALLEKEGLEGVGVIAKIETTKSIENFEEILAAADGIMVARGDLGIELRMEEIPSIQKRLVAKSQQAGKVAIVATQMLESMIENPRPTRAEVSDVANAVFDSASAIMLSGETAVGKYPIETVSQMRRIAIDAEKHIPYTDLYFKKGHAQYLSKDLAIAHGAVILSISCKTVAILVCSNTSELAASISSLRPSLPIFVATTSSSNYYRLAMQWGVTPLLLNESAAYQFFAETGLVHEGDQLVVVHETHTIQLKTHATCI